MDRAGRLVDCRLSEHAAKQFLKEALEISTDAPDRVTTDDDFAQSLRDGATLADTFKSVAHLPQFKALDKIPLGQSEEEETP